MTTYNTYQAAKIAMPLACIIHNTEDGYFFGMPSREGTTLSDDGCIFAEPQDYCMTVEKFLSDGYKFVEGDLILGCGDRVIKVDGSIQLWNSPEDADARNFILSAAALEEDKPLLQTGEEYEHTKALNFIYDRLIIVHGENQNFDYMHKLKNAIKLVEGVESPCNQSAAKEKPRTKVEYVKVVDSIFDLRPDFEAGDLYISHCDGHYQQILSESSLHLACAQGLLYRRIETPMTEREAFVESATHILKSGMSDAEYAGALFDSGKFKLIGVDCDVFKDRIRSVAEWEMNTCNNHDWESVAESIYLSVDDLLNL
ncbi:hypothetical protein NVP1287O_68 [Vibrio phage 1.287.O._10N.286.55.C7]|nr:hypothetical protein NVP1287O_68 [Vibrio phage 1.287.O._10N.286.55.C7]